MRMSTAPGKYRKHIRKGGFDYTSNHAYFVTIVTGQRQCVFGEIRSGELRPSQRGLVVVHTWHEIPVHHSFVKLDAFVVMPNHVHGVLLFVGDGEATQASQLQNERLVAATSASPLRARGPVSHSLGAVVGSFKASVSRQINRLRPGLRLGYGNRIITSTSFDTSVPRFASRLHPFQPCTLGSGR